MEQILNMLLPYIITGIGAYVGAKLTKIIPVAIDYIVAKVGLVNYQKMKTIALDVWNMIEEDNRLGKLAVSKFEAFEILIKSKIPGITDNEIRLLNKSIAGEVNKDKEKVVQAVAEAEQAIVTVQPKYVTPDGIELAPIQNTTTT